MAREAMFDPNGPLHAEPALSGKQGEVFDSWPKQYGWWLDKREPSLRKREGPALPFRQG